MASFMKFNLKSFISGILVASCLFTISVVARDIYENISVVRNTIDITIDGNAFDYDNFVYEGTTYVPLRAVAESLGFGVEYDDEAYAANIVRDCSFKFDGTVIGTINGYKVTDNMYNAYANHLKATQSYSSADELDAAVKAQIKNNVYIIQIANALDIYIDSSFNKNYLNLVAFMAIQYGGDEAFAKEIASKGLSDEMYRHMQEISQLKSNIFNYSELAEFTDEQKQQFLDELLVDLDGESVVEWE